MEIVLVEVILGGNFPDENCPGRSYTGWEFSLVRVFWVGIVQWESSEWQFSGWEFSCYPIFCQSEEISQIKEWVVLTLGGSLFS